MSLQRLLMPTSLPPDLAARVRSRRDPGNRDQAADEACTGAPAMSVNDRSVSRLKYFENCARPCDELRRRDVAGIPPASGRFGPRALVDTESHVSTFALPTNRSERA